MTYVKTRLQRDLTIDSIITLHYFEYMRDFVFHGESHNFWEFLYVDKGQLIVQADEQEIPLYHGDIIFHRPNEFHAFRSVGNYSPNLVVMSFSTDSPAMSFFEKRHYTLNAEERTLISQLVAAGREALSTPLHLPTVEQVEVNPSAGFGSQQMLLNFLEMFLILGIRNHSSNLEPSPSFPSRARLQNPPRKEGRLDAVIDYMNLRICENMTLEELCHHFSLSRSSLQKLFHEEKQCGVMEYYNWMKIEQAKGIIREGHMNLTEIAYYLSYSSLAYFSRCFKKETGMSPLAYASSIKGISKTLTNNALLDREVEES